jgi:tRNA nucleotidyltransferase (CCA-adding enzyme)
MFNLLTRSRTPSKAFNLMRSLKMLDDFFPELSNCIGIEQSNKAIGLELYQHIMIAMDSIKLDASNLLVLRLAALLHDIGKPYTKVSTDSGIHFYNHENVGAYLADRIMTRWGFNRNVISQVVLLIINHLFDASPKKSDVSIKKLIAKVGPENINTLIDLRVADRMGTGRKGISMDKVEQLRKQINALLPSITKENIVLNIHDNELTEMINKHTEEPAEAVIEIKRYLESKILSDAIKNRPQSIKNAVMKVNKINCPLDKKHLFKTWTDYENDTADVFQNGFLRCGVYCNFTCNKYLKPKPKNN